MLAELAEVSKNTIYKLERGESNPTLGMVTALLEILGLNLIIEVKKIEA